MSDDSNVIPSVVVDAEDYNEVLKRLDQIDEKIDPSATISVAKKCIPGPTRSQPNTRMARNPDSRKKAKMPSAASAEPKTSPTKRE